MKILILSDSHYENEILKEITEHYPNVDYFIHCGDSSLDKDDPLLKKYVVVKGNHDDASFEKYQVLKVQGMRLLVTHGHFYRVYKGYEKLLELAKEEDCQIVLHGHTHVPTHQIIDSIHFINPGSVMMNRGSYGFGTYAIMDIKQDIEVHYYHHITHTLQDHVLEEGLILLEEFKKYA